jgi:nickel/cobalt transporter (NicO) family protein
LSRLLHRRELSPWMILVALAAAFALGAAHALTPGHGKSIVAAYLVGSRGTLKHAAFLGAMVTFTHTISVFVLGLATLFLFRFVVPEKITVALGVISGLSIVAVGAWMLLKRLPGKRAAHHHHYHDHDHHHHDHAHDHHHHDHTHDHHHHGHEHDHHHGHSHSHVPDEISWGGLVALGASGGLVPCESALVLLLGAIALGRVAFGLLLLVSFSLGLALVLMAIGMLVLYAKKLLPERKRSGNHALLRWLPVASAGVVMIAGVVMTGVSLGWIHPKWMIG